MKHTPAPWKLYKIKDLVSTIQIDDSGQRIDVTGRDHKANARLITATPELLKAGKKWIDAHNQVGFFLEGYKNGSASISECNAASQKEHEAYSEMFELIKQLES